MSFAQAFNDAGAIISLIMALPAFFILIVMTRNIGNPEFDMIGAFTAGMETIAYALVPALVPTLLLAVIVVLVRAGNI